MSLNRLYKFGRTTFNDIMERFSLATHQQRGWRNIPLAQDYTIRPLWSTWVLKEEAIAAERWFETTYPKTFYCDVLYNGIRECRNWIPAESYKFQAILTEKYPKNSTYWANIEELQMSEAFTENYNKIYFIMLTKK